MVKASMLTVSSIFSSVPPLFANLAKILSGDIDCSHLALKAHSTDGSPFAIHPQAIIYPKTTGDIKHAISFAREYGIPLTVCGGQAASSGGSLGEGIIIDMTRYFSNIRRVNMMDNTITVDAGVAVDELIEKLSAWNLEIPVLQQENSGATIGGSVATKSATVSSFSAGTIREWIEGLTVVVDSGEEHTIKDGITPSGRLLGIYQSIFPLITEHGPTLRAGRREYSDDATGYSLWNTSIGPRQLLDQLVGSEGTLAIITSITFRVVQKKKHTSTFLLPVQNVKLLETCLDIAKHHRAERLFVFDSTMRNLIDTLHPLLIKDTLSRSPFYFLVTLRGNDEESIRSETRMLMKALPEIADGDYEIPERIACKLISPVFLHSLFHDYTKGTHMLATSAEGLIVSPRAYAHCVKALDDHLSKKGNLYTLTGFGGSGHIAVTTSFDAQDPHFEESIQDYRDELFSIVQEWKGGISAVGGDGLERSAGLSYVFNEATREVFKKIKEAWDPYCIFNPSKKIAISKDYLKKCTVRSLN
jgi:FAD/FMN-containing dehydrogenase